MMPTLRTDTHNKISLLEQLLSRTKLHTVTPPPPPIHPNNSQLQTLG